MLATVVHAAALEAAAGGGPAGRRRKESGWLFTGPAITGEGAGRARALAHLLLVQGVRACGRGGVQDEQRTARTGSLFRVRVCTIYHCW